MSQDVSDAISILACALRLRHHSGYDVLDAIENLDGFLGYDVEQWLNVYMDKTEEVDKLASNDTAIPDEILLLGALRTCPNESSSQQRREAIYRLDGFNDHDRRTWLRSYLENIALLHRQASITSSSVAETTSEQSSSTWSGSAMVPKPPSIFTVREDTSTFDSASISASSRREVEVEDTPRSTHKTSSSSSYTSRKSSIPSSHVRRVEEEHRLLSHSLDLELRTQRPESRPTTASGRSTSNIQRTPPPHTKVPVIPATPARPDFPCRDHSMIDALKPLDSAQGRNAAHMAQVSPLSAPSSHLSTHRSGTTHAPRARSSPGPQVVTRPSELASNSQLAAGATLSFTFCSASSRTVSIENAAASSSRRAPSPRPNNDPCGHHPPASSTPRSPVFTRRPFLVPYSPSSHHQTSEDSEDGLETKDQPRTGSVPRIAALSHSGPPEDSDGEKESSNKLRNACASTSTANPGKRRRSVTFTSSSSSTSDSDIEIVADTLTSSRTLRSKDQNAADIRSPLSARKKIRLMKEENPSYTTMHSPSKIIRFSAIFLRTRYNFRRTRIRNSRS
ncbi:uncharacterized protein STEHIDRAFT_154748 [Stereum hirsutum FP-91666 SS1]|uniref:uncharacterized protein n=1 Tax=Stereum hirsutum (strain FP-91666) TaxID=721885 RepID=UPI000440A8EA|nr:uncharacterized protein STEHIDRAFT_154748 [Stereum hirsutum FP-91666 SS1]EIM89058.1 hypothetical protein STEHIDRAFT_154748 [Stereum hirsutum FP-91666 SS1]